MALLVGFITAYPNNWWLVSRHLKHGMMTVRTPHEPASDGTSNSLHDGHASGDRAGGVPTKAGAPMVGEMEPVSNRALALITAVSVLVFGLGLAIAVAFGG